MRKDRNGYTKSLMTTEQGECYVCGRMCETARHEIYGGADRQASKALGMWVDVCPHCHSEIHNNLKEYEWLRVAGQIKFEEQYGHKKFIDVFGRNYLDEEQWKV